MFNYVPDKYMALGAALLQVWAAAANEEKSLDRETLAKRIRGGDFKGTIFGDAKFEPNGQLQSKHYLFTVENQKIIVQLDGK
jgi:branched-chain amino acid transport system substrate-binding protein